MELQLPLIFTLGLFLFMVLKGFRSKIQYRTSKLPPQPWKLPIIGHLHHLLGHLPHHTLGDLAKKHGPLMFLQLGEVPSIVVSSPRLAKEILKTQDTIFADRGSILVGKIMTYDNVGIIFSPYGGHWRQLRKICTLELLSAKKVQSFLSIREEEVTNLVKNISTMAGSSVNLSQKLLSLTNDITSRAAFGQKCEMKDTFLSLVTELIHLGGGFVVADLFPSLKFLHRISGAISKLERIHKKVDMILEDIIKEHRLNRLGKEKMEEDLVDVLIRLQEENDQLDFPIENHCIKAVILEIFIAGSETSSTMLEWALSELMRNPRIMEKAQAEVRHVLNGREKVEQSDLNELNYMKLVIKETLRLHPATGFIPPRENREKCKIDGYEIPERTKVFINAWAIGRDPEYWTDAEKFIPERFQDIAIDYKGTDFEYLPFGAGKRICPGISYGIANIELPLAQLLYNFDWKLPNGVKSEELDMTEFFGATVGRKSHLCLIPSPYHK